MMRLPIGTKHEAFRLRPMFVFFGFVTLAFFATIRSSIDAYKMLFAMQCPEAQSLGSQPMVRTVTTDAVSRGATTAATMGVAKQPPAQTETAAIFEPSKKVNVPVEASKLAEKTTAAVQKVPEANSLLRAHDSYNTTSLMEFKDLHRNYLLRRQEELEGTDLAHLSTRAKGTDADGNNITTFSYANFYMYGFNSGFRNQMMAFSMLVIRANFFGHEQLLLDSLYHKDILGSKKFSRFEMYFDVEHWNSYSKQSRSNQTQKLDSEDYDHYPNYLPRLVLSDPVLHSEWNATSSKFIGRASKNNTKPYCYYEKDSMLMSNYMFYMKGRSQFTPTGKKGKTPELTERNPADILMLQGALRPNPAMQALIENSKKHLSDVATQRIARDLPSGSSQQTPFRYMTLHARVEPDMQKHVTCRDKKVLRLQDIVDMIESKWPTPPVDAVFLPIHRKNLEKEGRIKPKDYIEPSKRPTEDDPNSKTQINWVAVDNLRLLDQLTNPHRTVGGLWNGTVPVVEFGFDALRGTVYEDRPTISGAIHDYWLGLDAHIFVGTEVSSFSHDIVAARFYRGSKDSEMRRNNYKYLPDGLHDWVSDDMLSPPNMHC